MAHFKCKKFNATSLTAVNGDWELEGYLEQMERDGWELVDITQYEGAHQTLIVTHTWC
jgi:hypothetical protein